MNSSSFDAITKRFSDRRFSRRQALAGSGAGLAAVGLAAAGLNRVAAEEATPESGATPFPEDASGTATEFLFVQSFQAGTIVPKEGEPGSWTLTLEHGLGQTIYFSDRPERIVGVSPTDAFLKGLGFSQENPPNAALLFENDKGEEDISVVELFNPHYDTGTNTATYDIQLLKEYADLEMTFQEQPVEPPDAQATFGVAHLFIDGCPDRPVTCVSQTDVQPNGIGKTLGSFPSSSFGGWCWSEDVDMCLPCNTTGGSFAGIEDYWEQQCNNEIAACCQSPDNDTCDGPCGANLVS